MYGSDKTVRVMLEERDKPYVLAVRCNKKLMMLPAMLHTCKLGYHLISCYQVATESTSGQTANLSGSSDLGRDGLGDGDAGLEMIIECESPTGGTEHRQQGDRESIEELMRICPVPTSKCGSVKWVSPWWRSATIRSRQASVGRGWL